MENDEKSLTPELDQDVAAVKQARLDVQNIHNKVAAMPRTRANALVLTKLDEASMWMGKRLQELQTPNPYPTSRDPSVRDIDKTAPEACKLPPA